MSCIGTVRTTAQYSAVYTRSTHGPCVVFVLAGHCTKHMSTVHAHGLQVFKNVFRSLHGDRPVRQLSEAERARLAEKVAERTAAKQARAHANPIKQVQPTSCLTLLPR